MTCHVTANLPRLPLLPTILHTAQPCLQLVQMPQQRAADLSAMHCLPNLQHRSHALLASVPCHPLTLGMRKRRKKGSTKKVPRRIRPRVQRKHRSRQPGASMAKGRGKYSSPCPWVVSADVPALQQENFGDAGGGRCRCPGTIKTY